MDGYTQDYREMGIDTPLGKDKLLLLRMSGREALSELFLLKMELLSTDSAIKPEDVLGKAGTVRLNLNLNMPLQQSPKRYFHGIFVSFGFLGRYSTNESLFRYSAVLAPRLWLLDRGLDCRIYHNQSVPQIVRNVLQEWDIEFDDDKLTESYKKHEYRVRYQETAFAFISRLMEQEGIYYYFQHEGPGGEAAAGGPGKHTVVLADNNDRHDWFKADGLEFQYIHHPLYQAGQAALQHLHFQRLTDWTTEEVIQAGKVEMTDYDFREPDTDLSTTQSPGQGLDAQGLLKPDRDKLTTFLYPGGYRQLMEPGDEPGHGEMLAKVRADDVRCQGISRAGETHARYLAAGAKIKVKDIPAGEGPFDGKTEEDVLLRSVQFEVASSGYDGVQRLDSDFTFRCTATAQPLRHQFRPSMATPGPIVHGPQTAIVLGEKTKEPGGDADDKPVMMTDEYGRIKVRFHWSRPAAQDDGQSSDEDDTVSCWIRVAQSSAGGNFGFHVLPRVGHEVVVSFLNGDPDLPLITGCVYNKTNMPPIDPKGNLAHSVIRSRTVDSEAKALKKPIPEKDLIVEEEDVDDLKEHHRDFCEIAFIDKIGTVKSDPDKDAAKKREKEKKKKQKKQKKQKKAKAPEKKGEQEEEVRGLINIFSAGDVLNQAVRKQTIKAGKEIVIEADKTITLKVGDSTIVLTEDDITLKYDSLYDSKIKLDESECSLQAMQSAFHGLQKAEVKSLFGKGSQICLEMQDISITGMKIEATAGPVALVQSLSDYIADEIMAGVPDYVRDPEEVLLKKAIKAVSSTPHAETAAPMILSIVDDALDYLSDPSNLEWSTGKLSLGMTEAQLSSGTEEPELELSPSESLALKFSLGESTGGEVKISAKKKVEVTAKDASVALGDLEKSGSYMITADGVYAVQSGEAKVVGTDGVTVNTDKTFDLSATKITQSASQSAELSAGTGGAKLRSDGSLKLSAKMGLEADALSVKLAPKTTYTVDSGVLYTVKAPLKQFN